MHYKVTSNADYPPAIKPAHAFASGIFVRLRSFSLFLSIHHCLLFLSVFLALTFAPASRCQDSPNGIDNGIAVGRPKVYDNRSLQIMLDSFNASLQNAQFFNQSALNAAFGLLQGTESYDVSRSLSVSASFPPKGAATSPANSGSTSGAGGQPTTSSGSASGSGGSQSSGGSGSGGAGGSGSSTSSGGSGQASGPPTLPILSSSSAQFGSNPNDLLADQVNLTYQVFNLRMLLERSLTDRLITQSDPSQKGFTRLQAVIEFDVTLDPPKEAKDSAAIVEISIETVAEPADGPKLSLVAVMPQEKTYNSAALNTHDNAFGGSAVAKMFTVGYTERHRGQVFYLFRDNDTMAFQRMPSDPDKHQDIKFGWQFRPVLGRRSVSPGTRQMFAIIALPDSDEPEDLGTINLKVHVDTYWKHYDHRSLTTTYHEAWVHYINPAHVSTLPLHLPTRHSADYCPVEVLRTARIQDNLSPKIGEVVWIPTGDQTGTIVVHGKNFFSGTTLTVAGQVVATPTDGLVLQSDQTMIVRTTMQAIATGDVVINGRYGKAVSLELETAAASPPISISRTELRAYGSEFTKLTVKLKRAVGPLYLSHAPVPNAVFVRYNDTVLGIPAVVAQDEKNPEMLDVVAMIANSVLGTGSGVVAVKFAFGGKAWEARLPIYHPLIPVITRTGGKDKATLAISYPAPYGTELRGTWRIILDKSYKVGDPDDRDADADVSVKRASPCANSEPSCHMIILTAKTSLLDTFQKFVIIDDQGNSLGVSIPPANPSTQATQIDKVNTIAMLQNEARAVTFNGQGLNLVKRVSFNNQDLQFVAKGDGTGITVFISTTVTSTPGHKDIAFQVDLNTLLSGGIDVLPFGGNPASTKGNNSSDTSTQPNNQ
jgi:hypothetical protein